MPRPPLLRDLSGLSLDALSRIAADRRLPPVNDWHPERCGPSEMEILSDGRWLHQGSPIERPELVRLFSTLLRREPGGEYALVTPAEKLDIRVEDTPFVAVEVSWEGAGESRTLAFRLNTGDVVIAGAANPVHAEEKDGQPHPVLIVRDGLEARIVRAVYYELAEIALQEHADPPGIWSSGTFFPLVPQT